MRTHTDSENEWHVGMRGHVAFQTGGGFFKLNCSRGFSQWRDIVLATVEWWKIFSRA